MTYQATTKPTCAACGGPVSTRGRKPRKLGVRYCAKLDCQRAKKRALHALDTGSGNLRAPERCSCCGDALPPRSWRAEDNLGRYCRKLKCRRRRNEAAQAMKDVPQLLADVEVYRNAIQILSEAVAADDPENFNQARTVCKECGLLNALDGWAHPKENFDICLGTLGGKQPRKIGPNGLAAYGVRKYRPLVED